MKSILKLSLKSKTVNLNMNGETVKYQYYDDNKRSIITIPVTLARALNWDNGDEIGIINQTKDGIQGLFLWKREKEKGDLKKENK